VRRRKAIRRILSHPFVSLGGAIVVAFLIVGIAAPVIAPHSYSRHQYSEALKAPGTPGHLLGTDEYGRDILSRLLFGARISIQMGLIATLLSAAIGIPLGALAGYKGGLVDLFIGGLIDMAWGLPLVLVALIIVCILGPGTSSVMIALACNLWVMYARVVRGQVLALRERDFIQAARAIGASTPRIIARHLLPNCIGEVLVVTSLSFGIAILVEGALSFLGMGVQPPIPSWGSMVSEGRQYLRQAPWITTLSGLCIMFLVLGFNILGDGLRDMLDPTQRAK